MHSFHCRILQVIEVDKIDCVLIMPAWKFQSWSAKLMLVEVTILLPELQSAASPVQENIFHPLLRKSPHPGITHQCWNSRGQTFLTSLSFHGDRKQRNSPHASP